MPIEHVRLERLLNLAAAVLPFLGLVVAVYFAWGGIFDWVDVGILVGMYLLTGWGITIGFHRLFTHRSFKAKRPLKIVLAVLGSMALEGPLITWVANHRKHHRFSDRPGDPHSPHGDHEDGLKGILQGLFHAHIGWTLKQSVNANPERYAKDLLADPDLVFISRTFPLWVLLSLAIPFFLGWAITGSVVLGLTALLWGGAVRIFLVHHVTFSINSLCHFYGRRTFETPDESRDLGWLAIPTMGESWHNSHHAFPTSARHGMGRGELDPSAAIIAGLERLGLVWDVVRVSPEARERKSPPG